MLEEHEWERVAPHLRDAYPQIMEFRLRHSLSLAEAKQRVYGVGALEKYFQLTGFRETNVNALWHHRVVNFGPACRVCGKPLRTPRAKMCAECGAPLKPGTAT